MSLQNVKNFLSGTAESLSKGFFGVANIIDSVLPGTPLPEMLAKTGGALIGTDMFGIDKKLSEKWTKTVLSAASREDIPGRDPWLANRLQNFAAAETHDNMMELADRYRAKGLSRYDAQAMALGLDVK